MIIHSQNTPIQASLPQWGLIFVEGADAASFLQNQLSNSVLGLNRTLAPQIAQTHDSVRLVGYCNAKGRLLASAWLGQFPEDANAPDRFALFISKDIAASIAKRLSMFVLRSKVKVIDASSQWSVSGYCCNDSDITDLQIEAGQICLRLPDVMANDQTYSRALVASKNDGSESKLSDDFIQWNHLEVMSAIPRIVLATQEQFVPQMINFESVAGVDFKKGCYPGQEIVARSQYRGAIKRRLQLAHTSIDSLGSVSIAPATELFQVNDPSQPAGMVVLSSPSPTDPNRIDLQVECKLDALESGEIHLGSVQGPVLKIDLLPYPFIEI
jgi:folate-binding protein YgfZ